MKKLFVLPLVVSASLAQAQTPVFAPDISLSTAQAVLSALPYKTDNQHFALGAVHFLRGIEKTLQLRWQHNAVLEDFDLPVLRLPIQPNPNPEPFTADLITTIFSDLRAEMDASRAALSNIEGDVGQTINLADLWFDVNMNNTRDPYEGVLEIGAGVTMARLDPTLTDILQSPIKVRFDTADVAWLTAYTHLVSGVSELVVAFDPTQAIETVLQSKMEMDALRGEPFQRRGFLGTDETVWLDQFAMVYGALNVQPNPENTQAAHAHFLNMIDQNKIFWAALDQETDNDLEWIPNESQTAALGFNMPEGTGIAWQGILADAEAILNGELLVIHWRISPQAGINVKEMFMNPPVVDIVSWAQGYGLLPYMEQGPVATSQSMRAFEQLVSGNALSFSFMLN